eukprot:7522721-Lingulodinium_polyedra.AAC.1
MMIGVLVMVEALLRLAQHYCSLQDLKESALKNLQPDSLDLQAYFLASCRRVLACGRALSQAGVVKAAVFSGDKHHDGQVEGILSVVKEQIRGIMTYLGSHAACA